MCRNTKASSAGVAGPPAKLRQQQQHEASPKGFWQGVHRLPGAPASHGMPSGLTVLTAIRKQENRKGEREAGPLYYYGTVLPTLTKPCLA